MTSAHVTHKQEAVTSHCRKTQTGPYTEVNKSNDVQHTPYLCVIIIKVGAWPELEIKMCFHYLI